MEKEKCNGIAPRVRIAPSPTGRLHIGNLRAALFNWLFARRYGGVFVIRVEDTDRERSKQEYVDSILGALTWVGMTSDETIVYQSQRTELYQEHIQRLLDSGDAYWSDPLTEENGTSVIRFRVPRSEGSVTFDDMIRGPITVPIDQVEDFVIARADGSPLYNFVVVVDDIAMSMTHIIRGEDHISNTPKQILLYRAFGAALPKFAHLPLILGSSGAPLSKRDAATAVLDYKDEGFLPDALCNYLVRLGWSHQDQEIFSREEMVKLFDISAVQKAGAIFDLVKLRWMNGIYIRNMSSDALIDYLHSVLDVDLRSVCSSWSYEQLCQAVELYKDRVATVRELAAMVIDLHMGPRVLEPQAFDPVLLELLDIFVLGIAGIDELNSQSVEQLVRRICKEKGLGLAVLAKPLRYALTGSLQSPSLFTLVGLLGRETVLKRVAALRGVLT